MKEYTKPQPPNTYDSIQLNEVIDFEGTQLICQPNDTTPCDGCFFGFKCRETKPHTLPCSLEIEGKVTQVIYAELKDIPKHVADGEIFSVGNTLLRTTTNERHNCCDFCYAEFNDELCHQMPICDGSDNDGKEFVFLTPATLIDFDHRSRLNAQQKEAENIDDLKDAVNDEIQRGANALDKLIDDLRKPKISKELFVEVVKLVKEQAAKDDEFCTFIEKYIDGRGVPIMNELNSLAIEKLMNAAFHDTEEDETGYTWWEWFAYETDYGQKPMSAFIDKREYSITSPEIFYDFMCDWLKYLMDEKPYTDEDDNEAPYDENLDAAITATAREICKSIEDICNEFIGKPVKPGKEQEAKELDDKIIAAKNDLINSLNELTGDDVKKELDVYGNETKTSWERFKEIIASFPIGIVTRQEIITKISKLEPQYQHTPTAMYYHIRMLMENKYMKKTGKNGVYEKVKAIPADLTSTGKSKNPFVHPVEQARLQKKMVEDMEKPLLVTIWDHFLNLFQGLKEGTQITRQEIHYMMGQYGNKRSERYDPDFFGFSDGAIDTYINLLLQENYLERVKRGVYEIVYEIPMTLLTTDCQ